MKSLFLIFVFLFVGCSTSTKKSRVYTAEEVQKESARFNKFADEEFDKSVKKYPEYLTSLGLKERYDELNDNSYEAFLEEQKSSREALKKAKEFDFEALDQQTKISYLLWTEDAEEDLAAREKFYYHWFLVNQMFGRHSGIADLMINEHLIKNKSEAWSYISRLNKFKTSFDQLLAKMKEQEKRGIKYPHFVFEKVIRDSQNLISGYPFENTKKKSELYQDFETKLKKAKISSQSALLKNAKNALLNSVKPAYENLIVYLKKLEKTSPANHGAWSLPNGKEFYTRRLKDITTTDISAPKLHKIGLSEVERIHNEMKLIMKKVEFKGNLKEFFEYVKNNPSLFYEDNALGRKQYLKDTNSIIAGMNAKLDLLFNIKPIAKLKVKPVEKFREKSAGIAFYNQPAIDGSRPGIYYVNLSNMKAVEKYSMEALAYHEAIPGHHMQIAIAQELNGLPKFRKYGGYTAYSEGWGLYAEFIPKEIGFYKDPYSDFGRLSMELWRACRLVVDTGLNYYKWSREKGIEYLKENTPNSEDDITKGVERYMVMPGQAVAYKVGQLKILELREKAKKALGKKFDIREFHDVVLKNGALPLKVLEAQVNQYIKDKI